MYYRAFVLCIILCLFSGCASGGYRTGYIISDTMEENVISSQAEDNRN